MSIDRLMVYINENQNIYTKEVFPDFKLINSNTIVNGRFKIFPTNNTKDLIILTNRYFSIDNDSGKPLEITLPHYHDIIHTFAWSGSNSVDESYKYQNILCFLLGKTAEQISLKENTSTKRTAVDIEYKKIDRFDVI